MIHRWYLDIVRGVDLQIDSSLSPSSCRERITEAVAPGLIDDPSAGPVDPEKPFRGFETGDQIVIERQRYKSHALAPVAHVEIARGRKGGSRVDVHVRQRRAQKLVLGSAVAIAVVGTLVSSVATLADVGSSEAAVSMAFGVGIWYFGVRVVRRDAAFLDQELRRLIQAPGAPTGRKKAVEATP